MKTISLLIINVEFVRLIPIFTFPLNVLLSVKVWFKSKVARVHVLVGKYIVITLKAVAFKMVFAIQFDL